MRLRFALCLTWLACAEDAPLHGEAALRSAGLQAGVYSLPGRVDAFDLELKADGSFRWTVFGCDYGGGEIGRWHGDGDEIVLIPREGRSRLRWVGDGSTVEVERVSLRASGEGIEASFDDEEQTWQRGGICAVCGGSLGPTATQACADPFRDVDDSALDY